MMFFDHVYQVVHLVERLRQQTGKLRPVRRSRESRNVETA